MTKRTKGFTLIELLVVISIISTLASTVLTATNSARAKGRDTVRVSQIRQVQLAVELYYSNKGFYPTMHSLNVQQNWADLLTELRVGKYISKAQEIIEKDGSVPAPSFAARVGIWLDSIPASWTANAAPANIQDPLYPARSYGYMPTAIPVPYQNFRLRAYLEEKTNPILKGAISGMFLYSDEDPETYPEYPEDQCAPLAGYYCIGPQLNSAANFAAFDPGKPVVYLYPEKTTSVSVTVSPKRVEESIPAYGTGWNVIAHPNGDIFNPADGATYPYLFWEGRSDRPIVDRTTGAVVKTSELEAFFTDALAKQGLNEKESAEFMEYWVPLMTERAEGKPFTYVYFMPKADYDALVPMAIVPAPDTTIRVYMLYKPLDTEISVIPQQLSAPARTGFTVVEWGGNRSPL